MHDDTLLPPTRPVPEGPPFLASPPPPSSRTDSSRMVALVVAIVTVVGALAVVVASASSSPFYADHWDKRIAPIAREVSRLRGLEYTHAVPVRFLSEQEFKKRVGIDDSSLDQSDRSELERGAAELRSVGLLDGKTNLRDAIDATSTSGVLAYYDPAVEEIVVRGEILDVAHRATLAHELTHVLQDQHFDIEKRQREASKSKTGDPAALRALIEGDASRIEDDYVSHLSSAEQAQYNRQTAATRDRYQSESGSVPDIVEIEFGAPYIFGPSTIRMLAANGGNRAVDRALTGPIPAARMFVEPGVLEAPEVEAPLPPVGADRVGDAEPLGPLDAYLMLAARGDPQRALRAADLVTAGRAISYRDRVRNVDCFRIRFAARPGAQPQVRDALRQWAGDAPAAEGSPDDPLVVTACDPGTTAKGPAAGRLEHAAQVLAFRQQLTVELAESGLAADGARCVARLFVRHPDLVDLAFKYGNAAPPAADAQKFQSEVTQDMMTCAGDDSAGIP